MAGAGTAARWPVRTDQRGAERSGAGSGVAPGGGDPVPGEGPLGGPRWLLVWNRDLLGECCCYRGTVRSGDGDGRAVGVGGNCTNPGKHPWSVRVDGEPVGFAHGAAEAGEYGWVTDVYGPPGGARQLAVTLGGLLVVDVDGERALRDFARLAWTVPREKILGVARTPRGFHVWLDSPGWDQKALNQWMSEWLGGAGGWAATDPGKAGRRGFLLDVRTGDNRYVVWPGDDALGQRRWIAFGEFAALIRRLRSEMPAWRLLDDPALSARAPWAVDTLGDAWLRGWIEEHSGGSGEIPLDGLEFTGSDTELDLTWAELEKWLGRLAGMAAGSGRNNALNQAAYYSGSRCIAAGHSVAAVRARLIEVGEEVGTHGVRATVESGLSAGMAKLRKQTGTGTGNTVSAG